MVELSYTDEALREAVSGMSNAGVQRVQQYFAEKEKPHRSSLMTTQAEKTWLAVSTAFVTLKELVDAWSEQGKSSLAYVQKSVEGYQALDDQLALQQPPAEGDPDTAAAFDRSHQSNSRTVGILLEMDELLRNYANFALTTICEAGWSIMAQENHVQSTVFWEEVKKGVVDLAAGAFLHHGLNLPPMNVAGVEVQAEFLIPLVRAAQAAVTAVSKRSEYGDETLAGWESMEMQCNDWVLAARQVIGLLEAMHVAEA